jgi:hypothetical protein
MLASVTMQFRWLFVAGLALAGCADMGSQVKSRAARDLSCGEAQTRIVDAEAGVYRITGCGLEAGYHCTEDRTFNTRCERLYLSKASEQPEKSQAAANLAKSQ